MAFRMAKTVEFSLWSFDHSIGNTVNNAIREVIKTLSSA